MIPWNNLNGREDLNIHMVKTEILLSNLGKREKEWNIHEWNILEGEKELKKRQGELRAFYESEKKKLRHQVKVKEAELLDKLV